MIIDLTTWVSQDDYKEGVVRSVSDDLLIRDKSHFYAFYGHISSLGIFRDKIHSSVEPIGRVILPVKCDNLIAFCKTAEDVEKTCMFHTRYSSSLAKKEVLSCFYERLNEVELEKYKKDTLGLSEALLTDTEARLELVRERFPDMGLFVLAYKNKTIHPVVNHVAIILNRSIVLDDEIYISGLGEGISKNKMILKT